MRQNVHFSYQALFVHIDKIFSNEIGENTEDIKILMLFVDVFNTH